MSTQARWLADHMSTNSQIYEINLRKVTSKKSAWAENEWNDRIKRFNRFIDEFIIKKAVLLKYVLLSEYYMKTVQTYIKFKVIYQATLLKTKYNIKMWTS